MSRHRFDSANCAIARSLDVLGDWWTLLIVREAFLGTRRFVDFQRRLDVARNILSDRLRHLVEHDVLERVEVGEFGTRHEYRLTARGRDLFLVITALRQWGERWIYGEGEEPLQVLERATGRPLPRQRVIGSDGQPVGPDSLVLAPGPGADTVTRARFEQMTPGGRDRDHGKAC